MNSRNAKDCDLCLSLTTLNKIKVRPKKTLIDSIHQLKTERKVILPFDREQLYSELDRKLDESQFKHKTSPKSLYRRFILPNVSN